MHILVEDLLPLLLADARIRLLPASRLNTPMHGEFYRQMIGQYLGSRQAPLKEAMLSLTIILSTTLFYLSISQNSIAAPDEAEPANLALSVRFIVRHVRLCVHEHGLFL